jgi:transmembrane sensor
MERNQQYEELVRRYLENKASDDELKVFFNLLDTGALEPYLDEAFRKGEAASHGKDAPAPVLIRFLRHRLAIAAAAACLLIAGAGLWYKTRKASPASPLAVARVQQDVLPGTNHASLKLSSGKVIDLDSNSTPHIALQTGGALVKNRIGQWIYESPEGDSAATVYNTLSAPRGAQFPFVLADGTRVWLNAASSLRFPAAFNGMTRKVILDGEAYFEVAPDARKAFVVQVKKMQVQVLGTAFNVNAYADEPTIRTTLLNGSVRITGDQAAVLLKPGERASLLPDGKLNVNKDADLAEAAIAWKNGYFSFDGGDIQTVMRQISRWYDVDVRYEGPPTRTRFGGDIGRDLTLRQVLTILQKSRVHFKLEGKILTVLP